MITRRIALLFAVTAAIALTLWISRSSSASASASESAAPGQLAILDRKGEPTGLCPLKHTDVTADIAGYAARVTVKQEFFNPSKEPVEALYSFPLPADAAVDAMTMTIGSRVVRGEIKRKEEARAIYDQAKTEGRAAALLDQERPNIFTQQVANIMPGATVVVTISYVNLLKYQEGQYEFVFPMVVGPRYIPGEGYVSGAERGSPSGSGKVLVDPGKTAVVLDGHRITPPVALPGTRAGHDISVTVHLNAGVPLEAVDAVLHRVSIVPAGRTGATITLDNRNEIPNRDFILRYRAAGSDMVEGLLAYAPTQNGAAAGAGGYFTMILQPPMAPPQEQISPKEMVFVIDQTGSQSGWPIAKAKETMKYCIANMNPGDTFQLIGFNTSVYPCFDAPVPNTPANVEKALKFLEPLEGNGGTDILKSVDYALSIPDDPGRLRIVCYMTDGYVGNDMQIIDYIQKHRGSSRMFPFGVGNSVNRFLIDGMAREGRGAPEYVSVNTNSGAQFGGPMPNAGVKGAKDAAERFYRRIASPLLLDLHVDWNGLPVEDVYPKQIPDVFTSGPIILKGRYSRAAEGDITVHGLLRGKPWSRTIHVSLPAAQSEGSAIATLWAREKIEDLQNQDWLGAQTNAPHPEIQQQITQTALEYHLMSQYTSFVAVDPRVINVGGKQRLLDVPVELPDGLSYDTSVASQADMPVVRQLSALGEVKRERGAVRRGAASNSFSEFGSKAGDLSYSGAGSPGNAVNGRQAGKPSSEALGRRAAAGIARKDEAGKEGKVASAATALQKNTTVSGGDHLSRSSRAGVLAPAKPSLHSLADGESKQLDALIMEGVPAPMTADQRRDALENTKLSADLCAKLTACRKSKAGKAERVQVQVWVNGMPPDAAARLKALGFTLEATLTPHRLLLGTVSLDSLDSLLKLSYVVRVETPKFR